MSCEGKDLNTLTQKELGEAYRYHAWSAVYPEIVRYGDMESMRKATKEQIEEVSRIHEVYNERFGSVALSSLVLDLIEEFPRPETYEQR